MHICLFSISLAMPRQLLDRLQSVLNAAARLIFASRRHNHVVTPSPQSSLATGARVDNLSVGRTRLPLPSRLRTCLPCF